MIDFKGTQFPKAVILHAVFFYVRYAVSYRDLEEIMAERGVIVDHATLNLWVVKFSPLIAANAQSRKRCQRQSKSGPKGSAKCCHFGVGMIATWACASIRAAALIIELAVARMLWSFRAKYCDVGVGLRLVLAGLALAEAVAVAIHLKDVHVVGKSIQKCAGQAF